MKLKDMARFTPQNGAVTTYKLINTKNLIAAVNDQPGLSAAAYAYRLNPNASYKDVKAAGALLGNAQRAKRPKVLRKYQDDKYRYYPANYKQIPDRKDTVSSYGPSTPPPVIKVAPSRSEIDMNAAMKEYVWETGADSAELKKFLTWYEAKDGRD